MYEGKLVAVIEAKGAKQSADEIDKFADAADNAEVETKKLNKALPLLASGFKAGLTAAVAMSAAMAGLAMKAAENEDRFSDLAKGTGVSTEKMKALAFAFGTAGVSAESLAETSRKALKDLGQAQVTGTGGIVTALDAIKGKTDLTADSFRGLSGVDVLQKLKNELDAANVPLEQQQFLLDGVARGAGALIPVLSNQGSEISGLISQYEGYNEQLKISASASDDLARQADNFDLLKSSMSNALTFLVSEFSPEIESSMKSATSFVTDGAHALAVFFDTLRAPENQRNLDALAINIQSVSAALEENEKIVGSSIYGTSASNRAKANVAELTAELDALKKKQTQLNEELAAKPAESGLGSGDVGSSSVVDNKLQTSKDKFAEYLSQINAMGRSELELIDIQQKEALTALGEYKAQSIGTLEQHEEARNRIIIDGAQKRAQIADKLYADQERVEEQYAAKAVALAEKNKQARTDADAFLNEINMLGVDQFGVLEEQTRQRLDKLRELSNQGVVDYADFEQAKTKILDEESNRRREMEMQQNAAIFGGASALFGSLADLQAQFGDKQGDTYRTLFALSKSFAIAQAGLSIAAAAQALADPTAPTLPQKLANYGIIVGAVGNIVSSVGSVGFNPREQGGQFSAGQRLLVGERGPELVEFGSGGRIENAQNTAKGGMPKVTIINQTSGRIDSTNITMDRGEIVIIAREVMNSEVLNPNSRFNKNIDSTRNSQRRL